MMTMNEEDDLVKKYSNLLEGLGYYSEYMGEANYYKILGNLEEAKEKQKVADAAMFAYDDMEDVLHKVALKLNDKDAEVKIAGYLDKFPNV